MLQSLLIKNYAIIDEVQLHFDRGYNVITGETGAGKSILLGALNLIRGARADTRVLYDLNAKCIVEANFQLPSEIIQPLQNEINVDFEDNELIIRREISSTGKSRAFINDTPVKLSELKMASASILDIHNQFDTLSISTPEHQLHVIDLIADNAKERDNYSQSFQLYSQVKLELRKLEESRKKKIENLDYVKFQLEELERIPLDDLIKQELVDEQSTLENSEKIISLIHQMNQEFQESEHSVSSRISAFIRQLGDIGQLNPQLSEILENMESALESLNEIDHIGNRLVDRIDVSDERLQELNETLDHINRLEQKHGLEGIQGLVELRNSYRLQAETSMNIDELIEDKKKELNKVTGAIQKAANVLTKSRTGTFEKLTKVLEKSLVQLAIPNAKIQIDRNPLNDFEATGIDEIYFSFSANKGIDVQPISDVASGGELSRLALSVKSTIADQYGVPTLIFDEIDTGISGAVAKRVGQIFQGIAESRQVICITHSPQVASLATRHFLVSKRDTETRTITSVTLLDQKGRINEIAKMLSTDPPSSSAMQNAKELLEDALLEE